jgi:sirohydrochlorin ferrochelatase
LARAVGAARSDIRVETAFLDFESPGLVSALSREADRGQRTATVVPLLLIAAYHGRVDVPGEIEKASGLGLTIGLAPVLGPVGGARSDAVALDLVVWALRRRLSEATNVLAPGAALPAPGAALPAPGGASGEPERSSGPVDALVLAAAGTRDAPALATVDLVAHALGVAVGVPCLAGYASGAGRGTAQAVQALRADGAERIAVASYFLAPGLLYDRAAAAARQAGALVAAAPLGDAPEIAELVLRRADVLERGSALERP